MEKMKSLLLVEDNEDDIDLTRLCLQKNKILNPVTVVRDGAEALDYLFGQGPYQGRDLSDRPAVVLLDLNLPKISGLDVLEQLRKNPLTRGLPVVIFTTSNEEKDVVGAYERGANSYLRKPVGLTQFSDAIRQFGFYWLTLNIDPPDDT